MRKARARSIPAALALALALGLSPAVGAASGGEGELAVAGVLARVQRWLDETRDLEARFTQALESGALGADLEESGRFLLKRPGRMRWDYVEPERKVALVEGERTRLYIAEDRQLWEGRLDDAGGLLALLLAGERPISTVFRAELMATPRRGGGGAYRLRLTPRAATEAFQEVTLRVGPPRFAIEEAEVIDPVGNRIRYRFWITRRNGGIGNERFGFEPPPGTEILAQPSAPP